MTSSPLPDAWRSLFAEVRAVESGNHARWSDADGCFLVVSESQPGTNRQVRVSGLLSAGGRYVYLVFSCSCPQGVRGKGISAGRTACRHTAVVARRLQRERLATWRNEDSRWFAIGPLAAAAREAARDCSADPAATLSGPRIPTRGPALDDPDRVADMIRAGMD